MSAAAVIVLRRKRLIRAFREAGATDRARAVTLEQLGQRSSWIFDRMVQRGVFVATEAGRYYLNERAAAEFQAAMQRRALIFIATALFVAILIWWFSRLAR